MKRACLLSLILCLSFSVFAERHVYRYGWEDTDTGFETGVLGKYREQDIEESINMDTVRTGLQSLQLIDLDDYSADATFGEQAYVCFVQNLQDGDIVIASFWRYNESTNAGCRVAANYTLNTQDYVTYFNDGDNNNAGIGTTEVWEQSSNAWVYIDGMMSSDGTRGPAEAMMILARPYTNPGDTCYIDDFELIVPDYATVTLPGPYDRITIPDIDPNAVQERSYDWEDGYADILGFYNNVNGSFYGNVYEPQNAEDPNGPGNRVLKVSEFPFNGTPQVYVAMVKDLEVGDLVEASFSAYDTTPGVSPSVRISAHYADSNDITSYYGAAGYNETYSGDGPGNWSRLEHQWAFASGGGSVDALVIEARLYSPYDLTSPQEFFIDDVNVVAPEAATIIFPSDLYKAEDYSNRPTYGWENFSGPDSIQNVLLGTFGMVNAELELFDPYDGSNALLLTDAEGTYTMSTLRQLMNRGYTVDLNGSATPEGYLTVVKGLNNGERVNVSIQAKSNSANPNTGVRLWAHYIYDENDLTSYAGSAGGFAAYPDDTNWTKLSYPWTFISNPADPYVDTQGVERMPLALVIKVRAYSENGEGGVIDDLIIEAPVTATVEYPDPANDDICVGGLPEYDFNLDCQVNLEDFASFVDGWLGCNLQPLCN